MTLEEFRKLNLGDCVRYLTHERQVLSHHGVTIDLTDPPSKGVISVPIDKAHQISIVKKLSDRERDTLKCLKLINEVRAKIGQRKLNPKKAQYSDEDVWKDAIFYIKTKTWVEVRARELGLIE